MKREKEKFRKYLEKANKDNETWMEDVEFMQDEQRFLEHLLSTHFLDLSTEKYYEPTKKLIHKLKDVEKMSVDFMEMLHTHNKHLATLIESLQLDGKKDFKKEHSKLREEFISYATRLKYVKKKIFAMIKDIMKTHKQKLLISER